MCYDSIQNKTRIALGLGFLHSGFQGNPGESQYLCLLRASGSRRPGEPMPGFWGFLPANPALPASLRLPCRPHCLAAHSFHDRGRGRNVGTFPAGLAYTAQSCPACLKVSLTSRTPGSSHTPLARWLIVLHVTVLFFFFNISPPPPRPCSPSRPAPPHHCRPATVAASPGSRVMGGSLRAPFREDALHTKDAFLRVTPTPGHTEHLRSTCSNTRIRTLRPHTLQHGSARNPCQGLCLKRNCIKNLVRLSVR